MDFFALDVGIVAGVALVLGLVLFFYVRRAMLMQNLNFHTFGPAVPATVLDAIRRAEVSFFEELPPLRRAIEQAQDVAGLLWPKMVFRLDFSVGAYRIKPRTIREIIEWAVEEGFLDVRTERDPRFDKVLPLFSMLPLLNDWQAALLLENLRRRHPLLREMSWAEIEHDPCAVAKLYSGYMGAGGAWDAWAVDLTPGPVAMARLGLS